jgi:hypothetical protein
MCPVAQSDAGWRQCLAVSRTTRLSRAAASRRLPGRGDRRWAGAGLADEGASPRAAIA